jgi:hypothetical protein
MPILLDDKLHLEPRTPENARYAMLMLKMCALIGESENRLRGPC